MNTTNSNLTFKGNPLNVKGKELKVGDAAPDFKLTSLDMSDLEKSAFDGKVLVISVVPSLDTPVCSTQTKKFSEEATKLFDDVAILTVSVDLPMAQKRWCGAEEVENLVVASDYKTREFGEAYGCFLPDIGLLARSIFVIGKDGKVAHVEYVKELAEEPNYEAALAKAKELR